MQPAQSLDSKRVLVVDDDPDLLFVTATLVETLGYSVCSASDERSVITILEREHVDLVICDMNLERTDGLSLLWSLKRSERRVPKFLFITGMKKVPLVPPIPSEVIGCLQKPVRLPQLEKTLSEALGSGMESADLLVEHGSFGQAGSALLLP